MSFLNNMMGVVASVTTGYIAGVTPSFTGAFLTAGIVLIIGNFAYIFLMGRLVSIPVPPAKGAVNAPAQDQ